MRLRTALLFSPALLLSSPTMYGQAAGPSTVPSTGAPPTASSQLQPALSQLRATLATIQLDKWKTPGSVREESNSNMASISRDLDGTLPSLLTAADGAPGSVSGNLPVFRNVDALYDVLLRVVQAADRGAPKREDASLHDALSSLENARRGLGDMLTNNAAAQDAKIAALQAQLKQAAVAPPPLPCPQKPAEKEARKPIHHHRTTRHKSTDNSTESQTPK